MGIERKIVNRIFQLFRERIEEIPERELYFSSGEIEVDESYFGAKRVRGKRGRGAGGKTKVFGMKKRGNKVYTQIVNNCSAAELVPIIKKLAPSDSLCLIHFRKHNQCLLSANCYRKVNLLQLQ